MSHEIAVQAQPLPDKMQFAKALAEAGMIPKVYQRQPANVLVAIELGEALGIRPIVAINEINVINGTPAPSASLMASLARNAGHKVRVTGDKDSATCVIVRADDPDYEHTATWDVKKAKDAGLWGRGHWSKDPATMLKWRAISECVRFACSEVLGGLRYTPEEVLEFNPPQQVESQRVTQPPAQPSQQPERPQSGMDQLAAAVEQPAVVDVDSFLARVENTTDTDELRSLWTEAASLPAHEVKGARDLIEARVELAQMQTEPEPESEQPTLDGEIVEDGAA